MNCCMSAHTHRNNWFYFKREEKPTGRGKKEQNTFYTTVDKSGLRSCFNSRLFHSQNHTSGFIIQVTP